MSLFATLVWNSANLSVLPILLATAEYDCDSWAMASFWDWIMAASKSGLPVKAPRLSSATILSLQLAPPSSLQLAIRAALSLERT